MTKNILAFIFLAGVAACGTLEDRPVNRPPQIIAVEAPAFVSGGDTVRVHTYDAEGDTLSLTWGFYRDNGSSIASSGFSKAFNDSGLNGDAKAWDGIFTGILNRAFLLTQSTPRFHILVGVSERGENPGDAYDIVIQQYQGSGHPPVLSNLVIPDTINTSQITQFQISVRAVDADGQNNIKSVHRITGIGNVYALNDAGLNGDAVANDSIYTETVSVSPPPPAGTYTFRFEAVDQEGLKSNTLIDSIVVLN